MKKIESKNMIVQSNQLIEAYRTLEKGEQKIIYMLLMTIKKDDADFKPYQFKISDFMKVLGIKSKTCYDQVKRFTRNLKRKELVFTDKTKNTELQVSWLSSAEYYKGEGFVELEFSPKLKPYLLQLEGAFLKLDGAVVLKLKSIYTMRLNEILLKTLQDYKSKERTISVLELRKKLGVPDSKYKDYYNFKLKTILQAQKEIDNNLDIEYFFKFEEIKTGRSVTDINFIIKRRFVEVDKNDYKITDDKNIPQIEGNIELFIEKFNNLYSSNLAGTKQTKKIVVDLAKKKGMENFEKCLIEFPRVVSAEAKKGNIRSLEGLFVNFIKDGYSFNTNIMGVVGIQPNFDQRDPSEIDYEQYYYRVEEKK